MYNIVIVKPDAYEETEQLGTKFKFWYVDECGQETLFKQGRSNTGENWSEKVCCELAELLGLPHASYEFATWRGMLGIISPKMIGKGERLVVGNEIINPNIVRVGYKTNHHLIRKVMTFLRSSNIKVPYSFNGETDLNAGDVFTGYLLFDALVGNTDRHDENWGVVLSGRGVELAPTYDHASSLGRELQDTKRLHCLNTNDQRSTVEAYAQKARSALFNLPDDSQSLTTLEAFLKAGDVAPWGKSFWLGRLDRVNNDSIDAILTQVPNDIMSIEAKAFAKRLLLFNKDRILRAGS